MDFVDYISKINENVAFMSSEPTMSASADDTVDSVTSQFIRQLPHPELDQNDGLVRPFAEELLRRRDSGAAV